MTKGIQMTNWDPYEKYIAYYMLTNYSIKTYLKRMIGFANFDIKHKVLTFLSIYD